MKNKKSLGQKIMDIYQGVGFVVIGIMAVLVMFSVIMRYFFGLSWKELSEFNVTLFTFTTFWGIGYCIIKEEHVIIDLVYNRYSPKMKKIMSIVNYTIVLIVLIVFTIYSVKYIMMAGKQISMGMGIPMYYMYGIMPICGVIASVCACIKIYEFIKSPISRFEKKEEIALINDVNEEVSSETVSDVKNDDSKEDVK